jgi:hypothetical protein
MMPWDELFGSERASGPAGQIEMRTLKKHGRPLLLVPTAARIAARCLDLYPAQTSRARLAKAVLRNLWRLGILVKAERTSLLISDSNPFKNYLSSVVKAAAKVPRFGILAGNPAGAGQRFVVVLFDDDDTPRSVVKAGLTQAARELIRKEAAFLAGVPSAIKGIPRVLSKFQTDSLEAFASDFVSGESPGLSDRETLAAVLTSWLNPERKLRLGEFPEIKNVRDLGDNANRQIATAIQHGDFAPWNIKVAGDGAWTVLDWERGEMAGIPAWDWFHYEIQTRILVRKARTEELVGETEEHLSSGLFRAYAEKAQIIGLERLLLRGYLWHLVEVIRPAEGLERNRALLAALKTD